MANVTLTLPQAFARAFEAYRAGRLAETEAICRRIVAAKPDFFDALHLLAVVQMAGGNDEQALANLDRAVAVRPDSVEALTNRGIVLKRVKRPAEAMASFDRVLAKRPDHVRALFNRAAMLQESGRHNEALDHYESALRVEPDNADLWINRGIALHAMRRFDAALACYDRVLAAQPNHPEALNNRGATLHAMARTGEALASFEHAIAAQPSYTKAHLNYAVALQEQNRYGEAVASYDRALQSQPENPDIWINRGFALNGLQRFDEALANQDRALSLRPGDPLAPNNRGLALIGLHRLTEALASFDRAIAAQPNFAEAYSNRGVVLDQMNRIAAALASFDQAIALRPDYTDALNHRGSVLTKLRRFDEAMASFERAIAASPGDSRAFSGIADCAAQLSDWTKRAEVEAMLPDHLAGVGFVTPFVMLGYSDDPLLQQKNACHYAASAVSTPSPVWTGGKWRHDKIRVAYLSADYRTHPIGHVMADLIETHDRTRFEIVGISYSDDDGSGIRKRIAAAFDSFHEVRGIDDRRVAKLLRDLEIDIAVDLQGYTGNERPGVFESRAAPIQASYLGYPSTLGAPLVDYIIADRIVLPFDQQQFYEERIVHLPNCYLVADRKRTTDDTAPTRQEMGLPDRGFVFVCFNGNWKITPAMFDCWMAILRDVEGSVLWLVGNIEAVRRNLAREATRRGIDPARLVFARRLPTDRHLARHALADLFLDTLPYNAHSTGQDALRTGLPVLTCIGRAFPARVGASLLHAVGLPELAVPTLEEYRALAVALACDPARLAAVKAKLRRNLATHPLLDTALFARGMEFAFRTMWEIWQRGERPRSFAVASDVSP